jgi:hypothetical protein
LSKARLALEVVDRKKLEKIAGFQDCYRDLPNFVSKWAVQIEAAGPVNSAQEKERRTPVRAPTHASPRRVEKGLEPRPKGLRPEPMRGPAR